MVTARDTKAPVGSVIKPVRQCTTIDGSERARFFLQRTRGAATAVARLRKFTTLRSMAETLSCSGTAATGCLYAIAVTANEQDEESDSLNCTNYASDIYAPAK